jgi:hypothetical protein
MIKLDEIKNEHIKEIVKDIVTETYQTLGYTKRRVQLEYITDKVEQVKNTYKTFNIDNRYKTEISEIDKVLKQLDPLKQFQSNIMIQRYFEKIPYKEKYKK